MAVKKNLPVYAVVGDDALLAGEATAAIVDGLSGQEPQRIDVEGPRATLADVLDELRSFAMFGGHKLVVVREADEFITKFRQALEAYVAEPSDSGTLVLRCRSLPANQKIAKLIVKHGQLVKCEPPSDRALPKWINDRAEHHGVDLARDAADLLANLIGNDLGRIDNELAKLALVATGRVTADVVASGVAFQREQQMWHMTDALTGGDIESAVRRWRQLMTGDSSAAFRGVTWLGIWLEKAAGALRMKQARQSEQAIGRALKIWPAYNVRPMIERAEMMGTAGLARAVGDLAELDRKVKTGQAEVGPAVETFLAKLAR
jgi:DNA polymerase-3 subunit delta